MSTMVIFGEYVFVEGANVQHASRINAVMILYGVPSRVYVTVGCPSTRPSVCPVDRQQQRRPAGLLLSALRAGDIDR